MLLSLSVTSDLYTKAPPLSGTFTNTAVGLFHLNLSLTAEKSKRFLQQPALCRSVPSSYWQCVEKFNNREVKGQSTLKTFNFTVGFTVGFIWHPSASILWEIKDTGSLNAAEPPVTWFSGVKLNIPGHIFQATSKLLWLTSPDYWTVRLMNDFLQLIKFIFYRNMISIRFPAWIVQSLKTLQTSSLLKYEEKHNGKCVCCVFNQLFKLKSLFLLLLLLFNNNESQYLFIYHQITAELPL